MKKYKSIQKCCALPDINVVHCEGSLDCVEHMYFRCDNCKGSGEGITVVVSDDCPGTNLNCLINSWNEAMKKEKPKNIKKCCKKPELIITSLRHVYEGSVSLMKCNNCGTFQEVKNG